MTVKVLLAEELLKVNNHLASDNRLLLESHGIKCVNIIASPGAGKTTLLEKTIRALEGRIRVGIVEGDLSTARDAERIAKTGAHVVQINTGGNCHLSAAMVGSALKELPLEDIDLLLIENVGNLVCPASFDLGEHLKAVVLSVAEGDDKPAKYPGTFLACEVAVISKTDLIPHTDFNLQLCLEEIRSINGGIITFCTSSRTGEGIGQWSQWLVDLTAR
ncbi:MAG: hydrogenase nickel incorporation protein HypB [Desulfocucumaceae bacterium]